MHRSKKMRSDRRRSLDDLVRTREQRWGHSEAEPYWVVLLRAPR
jgi:hypothetical protein